MLTNLNPRYSLVLVLQLLLVGVDILCNAFSLLLSRNQVVLLVLYMIQDIALIFSLVLLLLAFFNTFVFKAGLIVLLLRKFSMTLLTGSVYLILTVTYQAWSLAVRWNHSDQYTWNGVLQALYAIQKLWAIMYYFVYKRSALRLGDSHYYEDTPWLRKHLR